MSANSVLVVPPFDCAWLMGDELRFAKAGRGCVAFEARADNDVTVVFKEHAGCKHYRTDLGPNYTIILGSHCNRRLKILVDGKTVVDVAGIVLCPSRFERYWISVMDGTIAIGKGEPGLHVVYEWSDPTPNCKVEFVGLSSWDKHVGYRNIRVLPPTPMSWKYLPSSLEGQGVGGGLARYLESTELSDMQFVVGPDRRVVPAHRVVLGLSCTEYPYLFDDTIQLPSVDYSILHAVLQYMYTGRTLVGKVQLNQVLELAEEFGLQCLASQCEQLKLALVSGVDYDLRMSEQESKMELIYYCPLAFQEDQRAYPLHVPVNTAKLLHLLESGAFSDVQVVIADYGKVAESHRLVLSAWSEPFAKVSIIVGGAAYTCNNNFHELRLSKHIADYDGASVDIREHFLSSAEKSEYFVILQLVHSSSSFEAEQQVYLCVEMFTNGMWETNIGVVVLRDVAPEPFLAMLHFMYRGYLDLKERGDCGTLLLPLLVLADQYAIQLLQQECCMRLLDYLTEDSACTILQVVAALPSCQALRDACEECCARHFDYCIVPPATEFQALEVSCLLRILQHPALCVISEEKILDAIMMWAANKNDIHGWEDANCRARTEGASLYQDQMEDLTLLLPLVRFPLIPLPVLQKLHNMEICILGKLIPAMQELAAEAIEYLCQDLTSSNQQQKIFQSLHMRTQGRLVKFPRSNLRFSHRLSTYKELLYISDGDCNGVFYFIGTSFGVHRWMNPVLTKRLVVSASSPPSRFTDSKALVSRNYQGTSFAGPCNVAGGLSAWWKVDLGEDHKLMCNYYTVRQDSSSSFMRDWSFQGSMDGQKWIQLRTHHNDQTLCQAGQYASWPIFGSQALLPFRFFRVLLLSPTTSFSAQWNLSLCYLELYGYFR